MLCVSQFHIWSGRSVFTKYDMKRMPLGKKSFIFNNFWLFHELDGLDVRSSGILLGLLTLEDETYKLFRNVDK
jgi:hypothetical protein